MPKAAMLDDKRGLALVSGMFRRADWLCLVLTAVLVTSLTSCSKKTGAAVVVAKEHIDAREPNADSSPSPSKETAKEESGIREMAPDEIDADGFVMKKKARGTSKDPRASTEEQWRVTVEMTGNGRRLVVRTDRKHYEMLKKDDRVKVKYSEGNYTGTVWSAEFVD
jgi:hypothetical protein